MNGKSTRELLHGSKCPKCESTDIEWNCAQVTNSGVVDGRLRMHDVSTVFYLGCNNCSETLRTISGDDVAQSMNAAASTHLKNPPTPASLRALADWFENMPNASVKITRHLESSSLVYVLRRMAELLERNPR